MRATTSSFRRISFSLAAALAPTAAFAHPGHDGGHDLTWDFVGEVAHRLGSPYHLAPALLLGVVFVMVWRKLRARRQDSADKRD